LPEVVQELSIVQIHVGIKIWTLFQSNIKIDIQELIKYRRCLSIILCLLMFIKAINIVVISNHYVPQNGYWLLGLNIIGISINNSKEIALVKITYIVQLRNV
jgi:hypothetical protein